MGHQTIFIEAQRLFRKRKHGMDVVALELLERLQAATADYSIKVLVKKDEDICLKASANFVVEVLAPAFYPLWEQWILPQHISKDPQSLLHCTGNTAPLWGKNPLVVTIHDLIFLEDNYLLKKDGGSLYQRFGNFYRRLVVPRVARRAKHIVTVSQFQKQVILKRLRVPPEKVSVVYNGADERFFIRACPTVIQTTCKKYGIEAVDYLFFLGNTEPRKNTNLVLKSFGIFCEKNPQFKHQLVIKGLSAGQLQKKIAECGVAAVADRIKLVGYIDYEDLPILYQGAAVLWFPSLSEGFGLPIVEAMAGGTPVITSNVSVMPEIAGDAALYINPRHPHELASQTKVLLSDAALRDRLVEKGRVRADAFTWKNSVVQLQGVYEKLLR